MKYFLLSFFTLLTFGLASAQEQPAADGDMYSLSLEELMDITIVSASKQEESAFEAPITSAVITRQEIVNSGATSIPDALRLAPALIVREMANGSYDVSIRGGNDNMGSHQYSYLNTSILAMVDNRPIFNYYSGGTYWQNLPVDISDIERIEIVYGPNAPLYGPNAVDGVINIITRKGAEGKTSYGTASIQAGENILFSALAGARISEKLDVSISANHSARKRAEIEYYDPAIDGFITDLSQHSDVELSGDPSINFPDPEYGSKRTGLNFNLRYAPKDNTRITLSSGYNESAALMGYTLNAIFSHTTGTSLSNMMKVEVGNFTVQSSVLQGRIGSQGNRSQFNSDYQTWDNYLDYNLKINKKLSLRPAFSYQNAMVDDRDYSVNVGKVGTFNARATMYNYAYSLKADFRPMEALRIIGAVRADKFKAPDDTYLSYQGIVSYKINERNNVRFLAGRSYEGSFIEPAYLNFTMLDIPVMRLQVFGNTDRDLLQNDILELGYRSQVGKRLSFDLSVFRQSYQNFNALITEVAVEPSFAPPVQGQWEIYARNIDVTARQTGATLVATALIGKVTFKPSITFQKTELKNYGPYYNIAHPIYYPVLNTGNVRDQESDYAPSVFGGFSLNIPVSKLNVNLSGYYYSKYQLNGINSLDLTTAEVVDRSINHISGKFLLNANVAYNLSSQFRAFVNARNVLGQDAREAYGTDKIGTMIFAGINIEFYG